MRWYEQLPEAAKVLVGIAVLVLSIATAAAWLIFPFFVMRRLDQLRALLVEIRDNASDAEAKRTLEDYRRRAGAAKTIPGING